MLLTKQVPEAQAQTTVPDAEKYYAEGNRAYEKGFAELAISNYQKAVKSDPKHATAYNNMGDAYSYLEDYREAIRCYQKAIDIDPKFAAAYNNMGIAYAYLKDYREAIRYLQQAIDIIPNYAYAYNNMGIVYGYLGNTQEQIKNLRKAAQLGNENAQAWLQKNGL